jgi:hypothetical protein
MMRARLVALAERRARLSAQAAVERESLAAIAARGEAAARRVDRALALAGRVLGELRERPMLVAAGVALLVALRPRRALGWAARWGLKAWSLWRGYRAAQRFWQRLSAAPTAPAVASR